MKSLSLFSLTLALASAGFAYSCSSSDSNTFGSSSGGSGSNSGSGSSTSKGGSASLGSNGTAGTGSTSSSTSSGENCGATDVAAALTPVYIVFLYDSSGSMGVVGTTDNTALRWTPVTAAITSFLENADTSNVEASLAFFPAPGDRVGTCETHDYSVPDVPMTSLDDPTALVDALATKVPSGGTPTLPAVYGGIKEAKALLADNPGAQAIVVLVTDGTPCIYEKVEGTGGAGGAGGAGSEVWDCNPACAPTGVDLENTVEDIATVINAAYKGTPSIQTHVIGIGTDLTSLQALATAGGTDLLLIDPAAGSDTTTSKILERLNSIQSERISCNIPIPSTEENWDPELVNVNFVHSDGTVDELSRSDDCSVAGWRYDDATNPTYIELCDATCTAVQEDLDGKITIALGCETRVIQ